MLALLIAGLFWSQKLNVSSESSPEDISRYIAVMASEAGVDKRRVLLIAKCESGFDTAKIGDHGTSHGLFQIHLPAHPDVSRKASHSLVYSTAWALSQMQDNQWNMWSCDPK